MNEATSHMYDQAHTWNPFKGCRFDCTYCEPSFKRQSKRQKRDDSKGRGCDQCYRYVPHCHQDRLAAIPSGRIVFVAGNGDISFCPPPFTRRVIRCIKDHIPRCRTEKTFYFQSKKPSYFEQFLREFPPEVILVTTLETNRDSGYRTVSKAPLPSERYRQFKALRYPRKVVTIEPVMDFDVKVFAKWIRELQPEYVWLGFNSRPESVQIPEPSIEKVQQFMEMLAAAGIAIRGKDLRGLQVPR